LTNTPSASREGVPTRGTDHTTRVGTPIEPVGNQLRNVVIRSRVAPVVVDSSVMITGYTPGAGNASGSSGASSDQLRAAPAARSVGAGSDAT